MFRETDTLNFLQLPLHHLQKSKLLLHYLKAEFQIELSLLRGCNRLMSQTTTSGCDVFGATIVMSAHDCRTMLPLAAQVEQPWAQKRVPSAFCTGSESIRS